MKLTIMDDRSILEVGDNVETFHEGPQSVGAVQRLRAIKTAFESGFLDRVIAEEKDSPHTLAIDEEDVERLQDLINSVTSEVGRALVGLAVMQAAIKTISIDQSVRLHKGGTSPRDFSWKEGVSMRTLDKSFVTPALRRHGLLSLNADGFMMTRTLAENYPYTHLYKARLRGAKESWLQVVERLETRDLNAEAALRTMLGLLLNRTAEFEALASEALELAERAAAELSPQEIYELISTFIAQDDYSARLFEVALHSLFQVMAEDGALEGHLKPLSQMRSANKKHKNVGDVEIELVPGSRIILEAWDAKFGKTDLREEVEELLEKLAGQPECKVAGFVTDQDPSVSEALARRMKEIEAALGGDVSIEIHSFHHFLSDVMVGRFDLASGAGDWLQAFAESLAQRRREIAPIDEPCHDWLRSLIAALKRALA